MASERRRLTSRCVALVIVVTSMLHNSGTPDGDSDAGVMRGDVSVLKRSGEFHLSFGGGDTASIHNYTN